MSGIGSLGDYEELLGKTAGSSQHLNEETLQKAGLHQYNQPIRLIN